MTRLLRKFSNRLRRSRQRPLQPSHYLIDIQPPPRPGMRLGWLKVLGGAITGILGTLVLMSQLYQVAKSARIELELHETYSGFEVRAVNRGEAPATAVELTLATWPHGAPGRWVQTYALHDIPPQSERALLVDMVPGSLPAKSRDEMLKQMDSLLTSAYLEISCGSCRRSRIWAFSIPGWQTAQYDRIFRNRHTTDWPMIEVSSIDHKPPTGECVDYPHGVCGEYDGWKPDDTAHASGVQ